ncbi:hypothetical protein [Streptomyces olivaceiscleroticus]|uniref:Uncharacterized protein n=1 Tax=Streptomyces olivaceiscleroticus TaxID=68245 RepID=A0ABN1BDP3_9ACTN
MTSVPTVLPVPTVLSGVLMSDVVRTEYADGIAVITIDRGPASSHPTGPAAEPPR